MSIGKGSWRAQTVCFFHLEWCLFSGSPAFVLFIKTSLLSVGLSICYPLLCFFKGLMIQAICSKERGRNVVCYYAPHISSLGLKVAALAGSTHVGRPLAVCWFHGWIYCWIPLFGSEALTLLISGQQSFLPMGCSEVIKNSITAIQR